MSHRSSSGVRTLAAMFENQESTSSEARGRSPNGLSVAEGERPLSKVRSSFIAVDEPNNAFEINPEDSKAAAEGRTSTASLRRESMSLDETEHKDALQEVKDTVEGEKEARRQSAIIPETVPENAVSATPTTTTPAVEAKDYMAAGDLNEAKPEDAEVEDTGSKLKAMTLPEDDTPVANPDKPTTSAEEEPGTMQPADPNDGAAAKLVNGDVSNPASPEKETKSAARPTFSTPRKSGLSSSAKPATPRSSRKATPSKIQTSTSKPASSAGPKSAKTNSPAAVKTPSTASRPNTSDAKAGSTPSAHSSPTSKRDVKPPRASLTAPTAASAAKAKSLASDSTETQDTAAKHASPKAAKTQPKSITRPVKISSHLLAPTASSAAKHEAAKQENSKPASKSAATTKSMATSRSQRNSTSGARAPTASTSARSSLARSNSTTTKPAPRSTASKVAASGESFLARMTRATASSASKTHEKTEMKDGPKRRPSVVKPPTDHAAKAKAGKVEKSGAISSLANGSDRNSLKTAAPDTLTEKAEEAPTADDTMASGQQGAPASGDDVFQSTPAKDSEATDSSLADTPAFESATIR
ncbi:hypothetical protein MBLNU457_4642t1 [Dothideomycetes sp. NU457]